MLTLLKYELKKIFTSKFVIVTMIIAAAASMAFPVSTFYKINKGNFANYGSFNNNTAENYTVNAENVEKMRREIEKIENDNNSYVFGGNNGDTQYHGRFERGNLSPEDEKLCNEYKDEFGSPIIYIKEELIPRYEFLRANVGIYESLKDDIASAKDAEEKLKTDKNLSVLDQFHFQFIVLKAKYLEGRADSYTGGYALGWEEFIDSAGSDAAGVPLLLLIAVGVYGVFTNEYSTSADSLILSSRQGRSKRFSLIKLIASLIYSLVCVLAVAGSIALVCLVAAGARGANVSVLSLGGGYPFVMWQAALMCIGFMTASALTACSIIFLISSLISNSASAVGISMVALLSPLIVNMTVDVAKKPLVFQFVKLTPLYMGSLYVMAPSDLFCYGAGKWIDLKKLIPFIVLIAAVICIPTAVHTFRKRQVGK